MKIVFLDVDGVLNSEKSHSLQDNNQHWTWNEVAEMHLVLLKEIIEETGAKIVLSSSWRLYHPFHTGHKTITDGLMKVLVDKLNNFGLSILDVTPEIPNVIRGVEVATWLDEHLDIENYVILDDDADFLEEQKEHFIHTTFKNGLTEELAKKAIEIVKSS